MEKKEMREIPVLLVFRASRGIPAVLGLLVSMALMEKMASTV